jgi:hypothetical protein
MTETTLTPIERAMMWERMSGERLSDVERQRIMDGGDFVPAQMAETETTDGADQPVKRRSVHRLPWLKVIVRDEMVVLGFGAVEKPMTADQAVRLAKQLMEAARGADFTRGYRLGKQAESPEEGFSLAESAKRMPLPSEDAANG